MLNSEYATRTPRELLAEHSAILDELRKREILRIKNNPTGDYTEWIVMTKLGLTLEKNSASGFDAKDKEGLRYQIKGRRRTSDNKSAQLSAIRNLDQPHFDFLVAVIFDANWEVEYAAKITYKDVCEIAKFREHVNGYIMHMPKSIFKNSRVEEITAQLRD